MTRAIVNHQRNKVKTILFAGFLAGSLDILSAFIDYYIQSGNGPQGVLKFVASGVFGTSAFSGGGLMIFAGLLFHYIIAFSFTLLFYWLSQRILFMRRSIIVTAILYGIFIWLVMNLVVMPLSNAPRSPYRTFKIIKGILILICMIGLPLSIIMNRMFKKRSMISNQAN